MEIGLIGLGDMGKLYAREFAKAGYRVNGCDLPDKRSKLEEELAGTGVHILDDGIAVARRSDFLVYSVEAENIGKVVEKCGPSTKKGAIAAGQTSVKTPEIEAFERYLPEDVDIVTCHSLHGPTVDPRGQTLAVIRHRSSDEAYQRALETLGILGSNIVEIPTYQEHDRITADTQAVTHVGFESMGTAWKNAGFFPWENASYTGGIDNVKVLLTLRIYSGKSHVYAGLALLNPSARKQVKQYAQSESELFKMMIQEDEKAFRERMKRAGDFVFGNGKVPILLDDKAMGEFSLGIPSEQRKPNSHLSLLAMVDAWHKMGINPYDNMICQTPPFRLRLGIAEYLFRNPELLEESLHTAIHDKGIRGDDLEFHSAVREWASIIEHQDMEGYKQQFAETRAFFEDRLPEAKQRSAELIKRLTAVRRDSKEAGEK
jgi:prephenate dehydrogenase (NADP+)